MKLEVFDDAEAVAQAGATIIAAQAREAVVANGQFTFAVSGGHTPWIMLQALAGEKVPWEQVHLFQVDERVAPPGHAERNLTHLHECLLSRVPLPPDHVHAMPVEARGLQAACGRYAATLQQIAGGPPVIDLVHLGLGPDGHTASLVPGDPVLEVTDADVALTGVYQWRVRMTLTYPCINRARKVLWMITGDEKAAPLKKLLAGDQTIPAGRVGQHRATVLADRAAGQT